MTDSRDTNERIVAAAASCPVPGCGCLTIAYRLDDAYTSARPSFQPWVFTCPICTYEFELPSDQLLSQSIPRDWLVAKISQA